MLLNIQTIILAAGSSSRLGRPKQLISYQGETLLRYMIQTCLQSQASTPLVILGANANQISKSIHDLDCRIAINETWQNGMGNSISSAMSHVSDECSGVLFIMTDQPFLTSTVLDEILEKASTQKSGIIICEYEIGQGPPSYFSKDFFDELRELDGDHGAKPIVRKHKEKVDFVKFPEGHLDIDVPEDLIWLKEEQ